MSRKKSYKGLREKINEYFDYCDKLNSGKTNLVKPYTLSGLLFYTSLSRSEFEKLSASAKYGKAIESARARIEAFIEEKSLTGGLSANASANSLKFNFGWGDKKETEKEAFDRSISITLSPEMKEMAK